MAQANQADFFGEGTYDLDDFQPSEEEQRRQREKLRLARLADEEKLRLSSVPYGTPVAQGGTAAVGSVDTRGIGTSRGTPTGVTYTQGSAGPYGGAGGGGLGEVPSDFLSRGTSLAGQVEGADVTVRPGHQVNNANVNALTPVIDPMAAENAQVDQALALSQDLVDRVLNTPLQTQQLGDRALSNQLAVARSGRGGAGAVQDALSAASTMAPELLRETSQASINEQVQRAQAAGQAAGIYAGVASGVADRQVRIHEANQNAALAVIGNLTQLTGLDYQFDAAKMQTIGQLARDFFNTSSQFAGLDVTRQIAIWQDMTARYGIDKNFAAAMEKIAADEGVGPLDALKMVLGGAAAVGGLAVGGPAGAAAVTAGANMAK